jgi:hypothetical protein
MELEKTKQQGLEKFEQLQKSVTEQVETLSDIEVVDETRLAVANQQLSKTKQITNFIESTRKELKEPYFEAGKQIDALAKKISTPLEEKIQEVKNKMLSYNQVEAEKKRVALEALEKEKKRLEDEQAKAQAEANENHLKLQVQITKFESEAFGKIHSATTMADLSSAFTLFVLAFPPEYGEVVKDRIKTLGLAKKNLLNATTPEAISVYQKEYDKAYATVTGTEVKIQAPVIQMPSFDKIEEAKASIEISTPSNVRKTWTFEIENISNVPLEWLMVDESMVKEFMKKEKESLTEGMVYNGIKFYLKETIVIK